jgi:hypothetical protein
MTVKNLKRIDEVSEKVANNGWREGKKFNHVCAPL